MNECTGNESDDTEGSGWRRPAPETTDETDDTEGNTVKGKRPPGLTEETDDTQDVEGHAQIEGLPASVKPARDTGRVAKLRP